MNGVDYVSALGVQGGNQIKYQEVTFGNRSGSMADTPNYALGLDGSTGQGISRNKSDTLMSTGE